MTEKDIVIVSEGSHGKPVMNYEGDERTYIDKNGDKTARLYRLLLAALNASGFDSWVVLSSLVKRITESKTTKIARGSPSLSFPCGVKIDNTVEVPQYAKFTFSKPYKRCLRKYRRGLWTTTRTSQRSILTPGY